MQVGDKQWESHAPAADSSVEQFGWTLHTRRDRQAGCAARIVDRINISTDKRKRCGEMNRCILMLYVCGCSFHWWEKERLFTSHSTGLYSLSPFKLCREGRRKESSIICKNVWNWTHEDGDDARLWLNLDVRSTFYCDSQEGFALLHMYSYFSSSFDRRPVMLHVFRVYPFVMFPGSSSNRKQTERHVDRQSEINDTIIERGNERSTRNKNNR